MLPVLELIYKHFISLQVHRALIAEDFLAFFRQQAIEKGFDFPCRLTVGYQIERPKQGILPAHNIFFCPQHSIQSEKLDFTSLGTKNLANSAVATFAMPLMAPQPLS